ncbi:unnamed protein product, partial [Rangifer tarandus platyrhynchus]
MTDVQEAKPNHVNIVQASAHIELVKASHMVRSKGKRGGIDLVFSTGRPFTGWWKACQGPLARVRLSGTRSWAGLAVEPGSLPYSTLNAIDGGCTPALGVPADAITLPV